MAPALQSCDSLPPATNWAARAKCGSIGLYAARLHQANADQGPALLLALLFGAISDLVALLGNFEVELLRLVAAGHFRSVFGFPGSSPVIFGVARGEPTFFRGFHRTPTR